MEYDIPDRGCCGCVPPPRSQGHRVSMPLKKCGPRWYSSSFNPPPHESEPVPEVGFDQERRRTNILTTVGGSPGNTGGGGIYRDRFRRRLTREGRTTRWDSTTTGDTSNTVLHRSIYHERRFGALVGMFARVHIQASYY